MSSSPLSQQTADSQPCPHNAVSWWSSGTSVLTDWTQGACTRCGACAIYRDGKWIVADPPPRVLELADEVERLRAVVNEWQDWALDLVGAASTVPSARKAIERCVVAASGTTEPRDD